MNATKSTGRLPSSLKNLTKRIESVAIQNILGEVASVLAENASVIATVVVIGGVAALLWRYGGNIIRGVTGIFRVFR